MATDHTSHQNPHAIVIGLDCMTGLQAARILAERHVPVIAIAKDPSHYNCRTRVCEKIYYADTTNDELIDLLKELGPTFTQKPVLIACEDWNVKNISHHRELLKEWYCFLLPDVDMIDMVFDKSRFYEFATKHQLPVPRTFHVSNRQQAEEVASQITYPCIMKPPGRDPLWEDHTKFKVYKAFSASEMLDYYNQFGHYSDLLLLQEWIVGPDANICSCYVFFDENSQPRVSFVARKLRQWPPETGMSCLGEEYRCDEVLDTAMRLFSALNLTGLGHLEMKRDERTGKYVIIEAHVVRPTGRSPIAEAGGVELLFSLYCAILGRPLPQNIVQKYTGVKWIHFRRDLQSAFYYWRRGELTISDWWKSIQGKKYDAVFSWTDPGPFLADLIRGIGLIFRPDKRL